MRELLLTAVELAAYLVGTVVLGGAGLFAEYSTLSYLSDGNTLFAGWLTVIGLIALYAAFSIGTEKLLPRLRDVTA